MMTHITLNGGYEKWRFRIIHKDRSVQQALYGLLGE